jgi:hypothetical protein
VSAQSFRFAVSILTAAVFLIAVWAHVRGPGSLGHYLLASYALGQSLNVIFPHLVATLATRTYAPGLLTGILFVLPTAAVFLLRSFALDQLHTGRFLIIAALFTPAVLLSIPVLFRVGREKA